MDDLVDDFVFHDDDDVNPENRLYLFQFPQLFPKFKAPKKSDIAAADALRHQKPAKAKNLRHPRGAASRLPKAPLAAGKARPTSVKDEVAPSSEIDDGSEAADSEEEDKKRDTKRSGRSSSKEGLVGKLNVYRDGRVFLHFGELVMEVTGGSQSTFLQQVMLLDPSNRTATALGELHRKFIVSPNSTACSTTSSSTTRNSLSSSSESRKNRRTRRKPIVSSTALPLLASMPSAGSLTRNPSLPCATQIAVLFIPRRSLMVPEGLH